jgi:mannose-1-phosphate guanylyltransferase
MTTNGMEKAYAVIMAGGRGERFWPLSTLKTPKQTLSLIGDQTLLSMSIERVEGLIPPERILVITSAELVEPICEAAPELPRENVIGEPSGRDTAAVCALAAAIVKSRDPEGVVCTLTADHVIKDLDLFKTTLTESVNVALKNDVLITIGIQPHFPSTGFGYIETSDVFNNEGETEFLQAVRFVEKPDLETAESYLDAGNFFWNSGMFVWSAGSILKAFETHQPQLAEMAARMEQVVDTDKFDAKLEEEYGQLDRISIDYAIMEKSSNIITAKGVFRWHDVGCWTALEEHIDPDSTGNVIAGELVTLESANNVVYSKERLTALIGVEDLVVVQAPNATLICHKDKVQDVKKMVKLIADEGKGEGVL